MTGDNIHEEMIAFIQQHSGGVSSPELASRFLKFKNAEQRLAHIAVKSILESDRRCRHDDGLWHVITERQQDEKRTLEDEPWIAVYLFSGTGQHSRDVMHISAWTLFDMPKLVFSRWLIDVNKIPEDERHILVSSQDSTVQSSLHAFVSELVRLLENRTVLFFSTHQQGLLSRLCLQAGESMFDDTMVLSYLCKVANVPLNRPLNLEVVYDRLFSCASIRPAATAQGKAFAECAWELLRRIKDKGFASRADLEQWDAEQTVEIDWSKKQFSYRDIQNAHSGPGVYGFLNKEGEYIYIGKAGNVRKRIMGYFRPSEESPEKLMMLRNEAYGITVHPCGSELESLLYEYRLIRKYSPKLNTQVEVNERKGVFNAIDDSVFLLPHADTNKGMAVCFRKNQKISLLPFMQDFSERDAMVQYLREFFFTDKLKAEPTDFPEQETVFRWVNKNRDHVVRVDVSRAASAEELIDSIRAYWPEVV
ncbi:MAG: nucleotide excision repair endonuclease [Chitinispirillaceae bacterium]